jgi:cell division inhibitor SepF
MNMGVVDKLLNVMKLSDMEDEYDGEDYYDDDEPVENIKKAPVIHREDTYEDEKPAKKVSQKVTPIRSVKRAPGPGMEVCVIKPTSVDDAREITETLLNNQTVVLNLENLDVEIAQRIIDFASGSTYAISGNLQKISNYIFIITPACVDISGDFQEIVSGTFNVPPISHNAM